jgi:hypothetical protein
MKITLSPESIKLAHTLMKEELNSFLGMSVWSKAAPSEQRLYAKTYQLAKELGAKLDRYPETIRPSKEELRKADDEHEEFMKRPVDPEEATLNRAVIEAERRVAEFCRRKAASL